MKKCIKCEVTKELTDFREGRNICKQCNKLQDLERSRTRYGLARTIYTAQVHHSRLRGHPAPVYDEHQFSNWLIMHPKFGQLYSVWVASGYKTLLRPSVDRLDDYKGYSFDNVRLVTWEENKYRYFEDSKQGINTKQCRAVNQLTIDGKFIKTIHSIQAAAREVGAAPINLKRACDDSTKTCKGYKWEYIC